MLFPRIPIPPFLIRDIFGLPPFGRLLTEKDPKYKEYVKFLYILLSIMNYKTKSYVDVVEFLNNYDKDYDPIYNKIRDIYEKYKNLKLDDLKQFREFIEYCYFVL